MSPSGLHFLLSTEAGSVWAECNSFIPQLAGVLMVNEGKDGLMHNHCPTEKMGWPVVSIIWARNQRNRRYNEHKTQQNRPTQQLVRYYRFGH
jgi:hypothetical protein